MCQFAIFDVAMCSLFDLFSLHGMVYLDTKATREDIVRPALCRGYILAPTTSQQLQYKNYLSVHGKDMVNVLTKMSILIEDSHVYYLSSIEH